MDVRVKTPAKVRGDVRLTRMIAKVIMPARAKVAVLRMVHISSICRG